jgi:hypothetical protein
VLTVMVDAAKSCVASSINVFPSGELTVNSGDGADV